MERRLMSGMMLTLLLISMLTLAFKIQSVSASLRVHNIDTGEDFATIQAAINDLDTLNGHTIMADAGIYYENLVIKKALTILGNGSQSTIIDGGGLEFAVKITANNVALGGFTIQNGQFGITVGASNNSIHDNNVIGNIFRAIYLYRSTGNTFTANNVTRNEVGISLVHSGENTFKNNLISNNTWQALIIEGNKISDFLENMDTSNTVNGKPVYYWVNQQDKRVPNDAGYVALVNSRRIHVQNLTLYGNGQGVLLAGTSDSIIENVAVSRDRYGIYMVQSNNITIKNNIITKCNQAMELFSSNRNNILENNVSSNEYGIEIFWSNSNNISGNIIENSSGYNGWGVCLTVSANGNSIYENRFERNTRGITVQLFYFGEKNRMYHNNFIQNKIQVYNYDSATNAWDNGYPSGGNYWSDYTGVDLFSGLYQNLTGSDGIGDTPYIIDRYNRDRYPLTNPWTPTPPVVTATVDIEPDTLDLRSKGQWITAYIELPEGYNVSDIDVSSIKLNDTISAELKPTAIGNYDNNTRSDLMVKFNRTAVSDYILNVVGTLAKFNTVTLTITGKLKDGTQFKGSCTIKTICIYMIPKGIGRGISHYKK